MMIKTSDHEYTQGINLRWYQKSPHTTTELPVLQYIERGGGVKNGERFYFERWADVPLVIGDEK